MTELCLSEDSILALAGSNTRSPATERQLRHLADCAICSQCLAHAASPDDCLFAGRYRLGPIIGAGATGVVYRAFDVEGRRWVALKRVHLHLWDEPKIRVIFQQEVAIARIFEHPNVCRILDGGEFDGQAFLVMELADHSLDSELSSGWYERPLDARLRDAEQVVAGLAALHAARVVHRDLKPQNILRFPDGRLTVGDFGLAVDLARHTGDTPFAGTLAYLAPERTVKARAKESADVWSLGVVLHEMLLGSNPCWSNGGNLKVSSPAAVRSPLHAALQGLCRACLRYSPATRIADATRVQVLLQAIRQRPQTAGSFVHVSPLPSLTGMRRWLLTRFEAGVVSTWAWYATAGRDTKQYLFAFAYCGAWVLAALLFQAAQRVFHASYGP